MGGPEEWPSRVFGRQTEPGLQTIWSIRPRIGAREKVGFSPTSPQDVDSASMGSLARKGLGQSLARINS